MIPVDPFFLYSIREQAAFTWRKMLCELVDNAFDADANNVNLSFPGGRVFRIEDDGTGTDDLLSMITLGRRQDHYTNDVGRYGVGCKQALIWLWGVSEIESFHKGTASKIAINWDEIAKGVEGYPEASEDSDRTEPGTRIECRGDRNPPKFDAILSGLASTYTPGLEKGRCVTLTRGTRPRKLTPRKWPKTKEEFTDTIQAAGRSVHVRMGVVADGEANTYCNGFSFERTYRVIKESTLGANGFSVGRIAARITLGHEWDLSTNKDDFSEYQDELADAIHDRCSGMLNRAHQQAVSIEDSDFSAELASLVTSGEAARRRESRRPPENATGPVEPKETGRRRQNAQASSDQPGSIIDQGGSRRRRSGFTVEAYEESSESNHTVGYYDADGNRLRLNLRNPFLSRQWASRNSEALLAVVYGVLSDASVRGQCRRTPLFVNQLDTFASQWGSAVAGAASEEFQV